MAGSHHHEDPTPADARGRSAARGESMLRDGLRGIALVTAATVGLGLAAAVVALVVALLY
jgi:hypothetical protein